MCRYRIGLVVACLVLTPLVGCDDTGGNDADGGDVVVDGMEDSDDGTADGESDGDAMASGNRFADQLRRPVEVITDSFGMRHVYASALEDLFFMNGYVYAKDRFGQMEFFRRIATGTLSEVLGTLSNRPLDQDVMMRMLGLKRSAEQFWNDNYDPNKESFQAVEAYCRGVNAYLEERKSEDVDEPRRVQQFFPPEHTRKWEPSDVIAVARLLAVQLTYIADAEISLHALRDEILSTYKSSASDPDVKDRVGLLADVLRFKPATEATHIDGFPSMGDALGRPQRRPEVSDSVLSNAVDLHQGFQEMLPDGRNPITGGSRWSVGSNNWVLGGSRTKSGHPNVANDPHLGLTLPTIFYPIHLELTNDVDGRAPIRALGGAILGVPGVVVGRTDKVAWGTTVGFYDYVDVYREQLTQSQKASGTAKVKHEGGEVPVKTVTEEIDVGLFGEISETVEMELEVVPHHGPIIPETDSENRPVDRTQNEALSVDWVGLEASNSLAFLLDLYRAEDPEEVEGALDHYKVGSSNFVFGFTNGDIFYSGQSDIPDRPASALTFHPTKNPKGNSPAFILPGDGSADWEGFVSESNIPHATNPSKDYIVTANNDQVGTTLDGDPLNDKEYLGSLYASGYRAERITTMIENPSDVGDGDAKLSLDEQTTIQNDGKDLVAKDVVPHMVNAADTVLDNSVPDNSEPDLKEVRAFVQNRTDGKQSLRDMRDLLKQWDYVTPGTRSPSGEDVDRSSAATLFNTAMVYALRDAFGDEFAAIGRYANGSFDLPFSGVLLPRLMAWALNEPEESELYKPSIGETILFDDMSSDGVTETRISVLVRSLFKARDRLASSKAFGSKLEMSIPSPASGDPQDWVWGNLHGLTLEGMLPGQGRSDFARPKPSAALPFYPRPGGQHAVSPCNHGFDDFNFTCTSGSSLRMVHDMDPQDPVTYNAIPGGYSMTPSNPTYMSEFDRWQNANPREVKTDPAELRDDARSTMQFGPAP